MRVTCFSAGKVTIKNHSRVTTRFGRTFANYSFENVGECYHIVDSQGRTQGGFLGLNPPLELDILQKLYYLRKEINCFRIFFIVNLST